ncbi:MAG TPA: hypothetical protein VNT26_12125 [Candidatus Sulfotelmatobacter sp.]|nr:hypothetical protein [Candidatus Sulfotelmatobacter sp.]HWI60069.1 hypothetical protein [Bacillota bacterium]
MKTTRKKSSQPLAKGQLWAIEGGYIYIVDLGKRLISYKLMRQQGQRAVKTQMVAIDSLQAYLQEKAARLLKSSAAN